MKTKLKTTFSYVAALVGVCGAFAYYNTGNAAEDTSSQFISSYYNDKAISADKFEALTKALDAGVEKFQAQNGMFIIMDAADATVLATYSKDKSEAVDQKLYEAGSVYKVFDIAMGLESGSITAEEQIDTSEPLVIGKKKITDKQGSHEMLTLERILVESSSIGAAKIALKVGGEYQYDFFNKLGLLSKIDAYNINSSVPLSLKKNKWVNDEQLIATISYGYGVSDTPLHIITAYSAIVNGGTYYKPSLEKIDDKEGVRVISEDNSMLMRKYLRKVVTDGTAKKANSDKYVLMGKTGTADKVKKDGKYDSEHVISTLVGNFEYDGKNYAILVMLDDPKGLEETYGFVTAGWNAVPTAKNIIEEFIK